MQDKRFDRISGAALKERMKDEAPNNGDANEGYALVNVLSAADYAKEHIPSSINIPKGNEGEFEKRFSKDKEIVVYCASPECDASPAVADELVSRGFRNVADFEAGMSGWKRAGRPVETASA